MRLRIILCTLRIFYIHWNVWVLDNMHYYASMLSICISWEMSNRFLHLVHSGTSQSAICIWKWFLNWVDLNLLTFHFVWSNKNMLDLRGGLCVYFVCLFLFVSSSKSKCCNFESFHLILDNFRQSNVHVLLKFLPNSILFVCLFVFYFVLFCFFHCQWYCVASLPSTFEENFSVQLYVITLKIKRSESHHWPV